MRAFKIASAVAILLALVFLPVISSARTWNVPSEAATIQAGIDSASAGDTVIVECGTYYEHDITMKSGIVLRSETGLADCVRIDAESQRGFTCSSLDSTTAIEGLTIANATVGAGDDGAGMDVDSSSFYISNCDFDSCSARSAGGIYFYESRPVLTNCNFRGCSALVGRGGAIAIITGTVSRFSILTLVGCNFEGNTAPDRGGAVNSQIGKVSAVGCRFSGNSCDAVGGAVSISQADSVIQFTDCIFDGNSSGDIGGGAIFARGCSLVVEGCTMHGNSAVVGGGAISLQNVPTQTSLTIDKTIIAFGTQGDPVYCTGGESVAVSCSDIYGNAAGDWVGCIAGMDGSNGNFSLDPLFCSRETGDYSLRSCSPCIDAPGCGLVGALGEGGCPRVWQVPGDAATIQAGIDSACAGDTVLVAPGTYNENLTVKSGIYVIAESADPTATVVDANGVGAPVRFLHLPETSYLEGFTLTDGFANYGGGVVCINAAPEIINCRIVDNHVNLQGGAILCETSAAPVFTDCIIAGNTSGDVGGVLASYSFSNTTFANCTMYGNYTWTSGIIYVYSSSANIQNSIIAFSTRGEAVYCVSGGTASLSCSDVYGNAGGDWVGCIAGQAGTNGNFSEDPRFCDAPAGDFHISPCSPCADAPGCGLVGAMGTAVCPPRAWHVPADVATIKAAVDTACAGDTVIVACGTYYEHDIVMKQGVYLTSETGWPDCVTIDANSLGRVMICENLDLESETNIIGLRFVRGLADSGGAMYCVNSDLTLVGRCDFDSSHATEYGGGVACNTSTLTPTECSFTGNTAGHGGGAYATGGSALSIANCDFSGNAASTSGGGVYVSGSSSLYVADSDFLSNASGSYGGALASDGCPVSVSRCYFHDNSASSGGAVTCEYSAPAAFGNCVFNSNFAYTYGGAVLAENSSMAIGRCTFEQNDADYGGGVFSEVSTLTLSDCALTSNTGSDTCGGVFLRDNPWAKLQTCSLSSNSGGDLGGGVLSVNSGTMIEDCRFDQNSSSQGGAIASRLGSADTVRSCTFDGNSADLGGGGVYSNSSAIDINGCTFTGNSTSINGGAMLLYQLSAALVDSCDFYANSADNGGGIFVEDTSPLIRNCVFQGGDARYGGGVYAGSGSACTFEACVFDSNSANTRGGALVADNAGAQTVTRCDFTRNSAYFGAAIGLETSAATIDSSSFSGNYADQYGGGVWIGISDPVAINACSFFNNGAGSDGGGVVLLSGSLSLAGCVFDGSSASMSGGAIFADYSSLDIDECTIHGSDAPTGAGLYCTFTSPTIDNTIIAFSTMGEAVYCDMTSTPTVACSNIYGNAGGDWVGCIVGLDGTAGNIAVDPRFCDAAGGDFTLRSDSQCLYSSCGRIGAFGRGCFGDNPVIGGITDVGNDQGREVRLLWERSGFDAPGDTVDITGYEIYQRQDEFLALDHGKEPIRLEAQTGTGAPLYEGWDYIGTAPAHGESLYQYRCPTLCDSTAQDSICWSVYFVRAVTPDPFTYYDSYPDSGYSVDNLAPSPPPGLNMTSATELAWEEVPDEDFDYYSVYGSSVAELDETATLIGYTIDTAKDITGHVYDYYQVTATDFSGNEGEESSVGNTYAGVHDLPDMSDTPAKFALRQNRPNPFSSITVIAFDLPEETGARITVYDTHGRIIKRLTNKNYEAGRHSVAWLGDDERGSRVGSGVYFVRMQAGDFDDMKKVMLLR